MRCKGDVRTKSHPEGSIMEGHLFYESLTLCARYLHSETQFSRQVRNDDRQQVENCSTTTFFHSFGQGLAGKCTVSLDYKTWLESYLIYLKSHFSFLFMVKL
jgi:hypothetical protein